MTAIAPDYLTTLRNRMASHDANIRDLQEQLMVEKAMRGSLSYAIEQWEICHKPEEPKASEINQDAAGVYRRGATHMPDQSDAALAPAPLSREATAAPAPDLDARILARLAGRTSGLRLQELTRMPGEPATIHEVLSSLSRLESKGLVQKFVGSAIWVRTDAEGA